MPARLILFPDSVSPRRQPTDAARRFFLRHLRHVGPGSRGRHPPPLSPNFCPPVAVPRPPGKREDTLAPRFAVPSCRLIKESPAQGGGSARPVCFPQRRGSAGFRFSPRGFYLHCAGCTADIMTDCHSHSNSPTGQSKLQSPATIRRNDPTELPARTADGTTPFSRCRRGRHRGKGLQRGGGDRTRFLFPVSGAARRTNGRTPPRRSLLLFLCGISGTSGRGHVGAVSRRARRIFFCIVPGPRLHNLLSKPLP